MINNLLLQVHTSSIVTEDLVRYGLKSMEIASKLVLVIAKAEASYKMEKILRDITSNVCVADVGSGIEVKRLDRSTNKKMFKIQQECCTCRRLVKGDFTQGLLIKIY